MISMTTRKEIAMIECNESDLAVVSNKEDKESHKTSLTKCTIANMKQLRKNSLPNESLYKRTRCLIRYYYEKFINSKLPIFLCIIIYLLICGTGNFITGIIWFKYHNSPIDTYQKAIENIGSFNNITFSNYDLNETMLPPAFEKEAIEHEDLNILSLLKNLNVNEVSIRNLKNNCRIA